MDEPYREIDFERWYRELYKKYTSMRDYIESKNMDIYTSIPHDPLLETIEEGLRTLKAWAAPVEWKRTAAEIREIEKIFEKWSLYIDANFRSL